MTLDSEVATLPPEKPVVKMPWRLQKGLPYIKIYPAFWDLRQMILAIAHHVT
ncbi:MAG: hypothetical protein MUP08_01970 [Desulfobulbaceae bacterium]|nr:hypothetical protein [Desulfobulbaceae bacterium]